MAPPCTTSTPQLLRKTFLLLLHRSCFPCIRPFSTHNKFSLAKLSRDDLVAPPATTRNSTTAAQDIAGMEQLPPSSAIHSAGKAWWGPDASTGMWAPIAGDGSERGRTIHDSVTVHHPEQPWFREDVHSPPTV